MFKKSRQIFRIIFPRAYDPEANFIARLENNRMIKTYQKNDSCYEVIFKNQTKVYIRNHEHSDILVFDQVFRFQEYKIVKTFCKLNNLEPRVIIDAGANVGYTSVYFSSWFQNAKIIAIEPDSENFEMLKANLQVQETQGYKLYQRALTSEKNKRFDLQRNFRDGKDWAINTSISNSGAVEGITLEEIIYENKLEIIDILKIDIEGGERFLFDDRRSLSFLDKTRILVIEIHDEFNIRSRIYRILKDENFMLLENGELSIAFNMNFFEM